MRRNRVFSFGVCCLIPFFEGGFGSTELEYASLSLIFRQTLMHELRGQRWKNKYRIFYQLFFGNYFFRTIPVDTWFGSAPYYEVYNWHFLERILAVHFVICNCNFNLKSFLRNVVNAAAAEECAFDDQKK